MKFFNPFKIVIATCLVLLVHSSVSLQALEKIILNMDVNNTLIATDSSADRNLDQTLNYLLAGEFVYLWSSELTEPISYRAYVEEYLAPGDADDLEVKRRRKILFSQFLSFLQKNSHPLANEVSVSYQNLKNKLKDCVVFPSFLNLIAWLKKEELPYRIVLRTFGGDIDLVVASIAETFPHEDFCARGKFEKGVLHLAKQSEEFSLDQWEKIYDFITTAPAHVALQDDWKIWVDKHRMREFGKKFFLNSEDGETLSLFFDDNVNTDATSLHNIVDPVDVKTHEHLDIAELIAEKKLFRVNTYQAIIDDDYFIKLVSEAIELSEIKKEAA